MEWKVGEIKQVNGEWYQCVKSNDTCNGCIGKFQPYSFCHDFEECAGKIFKKLEKVGEPYEHDEKFYQCYKLPMETEIRLLPNNCYPIGKDNLVEIEIKQKEDMEEKKQCGDNRFRTIAKAKEHLFQVTNIAEDKKELEVLDSFLMRCWQMGWLKQYEDVEEKKSNLSPFDIQKAREGKPVCTRDGRNARIICFDRKDNTPIVALIERVNHAEILQCVHNNGKCFHYDTSNNDLMMLPEKKGGWILLRKDGCVFDNEEVAKKNCTDDYFVAKVEWEE